MLSRRWLMGVMVFLMPVIKATKLKLTVSEKLIGHGSYSKTLVNVYEPDTRILFVVSVNELTLITFRYMDFDMRVAGQQGKIQKSSQLRYGSPDIEDS